MELLDEDMKAVGVRREDADDRMRWNQKYAVVTPTGRAERKRTSFLARCL